MVSVPIGVPCGCTVATNVTWPGTSSTVKSDPYPRHAYLLLINLLAAFLWLSVLATRIAENKSPNLNVARCRESASTSGKQFSSAVAIKVDSLREGSVLSQRRRAPQSSCTLLDRL